MSKSNWYNDIESEISNLTSLGLLKALNKFKRSERTILANLFIKKINQNKNFRPLVFYVGYCLAKGQKLIGIELLPEKEKLLIGDITAALEIENISTYYFNHYLDNKSDIKNKQNEKNRVLAGMLCRNIQQEIIEELDVNTRIKFKITKILRQIDQDITKAQIHEINTGIFENMGEFSDEKEFRDVYFERCRKISGQFYGRCAEIGYIIGSNSTARSKDKQMIKNFYTEMATLGQFGNDIGDYALADTHSGTIEKNFYKDYGSDFKNQRLTYPNYLLLKRLISPKDEEIVTSILKKGFTKQTIPVFIKLMKKLEIFDDSFLLLNNRFNQIKKTLTLPRSELRTLVSSSVIVFRSNKLLNSVKNSLK